MPSSKQRLNRKKTEVVPEPEEDQADKPSVIEKPRNDGLSGHGAESALAHLREREIKREKNKG